MLVDIEFETLRFDVVWRFDLFNRYYHTMSYGNSIFNISASTFSILVFDIGSFRSHSGGICHV